MPSNVEMSRVSVQLPVETVDQLVTWAFEAGLKPGQFYSAALVIGARALARQALPERFHGVEDTIQVPVELLSRRRAK